jgi:hypothetical protein
MSMMRKIVRSTTKAVAANPQFPGVIMSSLSPGRRVPEGDGAGVWVRATRRFCTDLS